MEDEEADEDDDDDFAALSELNSDEMENDSK